MKKSKFVSLGVIFVLLLNYLSVFSIVAEEEKKTTIAVYELSAKDVSVGMVSVLSDVLRDAIFQTGRYEMLTKEDMQRILENMAEKQQVKPECDSDACIAEIAGALGVEEMVSGSVGKVGKTFVINLRLIDTEMAKTKNTVSITCPCEEDVLIEKVKKAGLQLLKIVEEKAVKEPEKKPAPVKETYKAPVAPPPKEKVVVAAPAPVVEPEPETISEERGSKTWLWWTLGILAVAGGAAAAAGGGAKSSGGGGGGGGGGGDTGGGTPTTGSITVNW